MNITTSINAVSMSSREIAELVGSRHDSVKRTIERLVGQGVIQLPPMVEVKNHLGQAVAEYVFTGEKGKRDSIVVVAQLSPEFTAALVDRWQALEAKLAQPIAMPSYAESLRLLADQIEETARVTAERDLAVATKALIGSKREATAMATASAASKKARQLEQELGRGTQHATITAVENATGRKFGAQGFRPLKAWCKRLDVIAPKAQCPRYGEVRSWPAQAWMDVYGVDLGELFGEVVA